MERARACMPRGALEDPTGPAVDGEADLSFSFSADAGRDADADDKGDTSAAAARGVEFSEVEEEEDGAAFFPARRYLLATAAA